MYLSTRLAALVVIGIAVCLPLTSCTSSADNLVRSVQQQSAGSSWYGGQEEGVAVFLQWVKVGSDLTGSIEGVTKSDTENLKSTRQFTGVLSGENFVLNFTDDQASAKSATGHLVGADVIINTPEPDGSLTPELLKAGTVSDFNKLVGQLAGSPATGTAQTSTPPATFDTTRVDADVTKKLTDPAPGGYGQSGVTGVTCPDNQPVVIGSTFTCTATINGTSKSVLITVKDSNGKYEVGIPS